MSSEFGANIDERKERNQSKYRKTNFLKLTEGERTIRILDKAETKHYTHYIGFSYVKCLGEECPICKNNKKILYEHPEDFRDVKGWLPRRDRYYVNVMDKTVAKLCTECKTEAEPTATICPGCGAALENPASPLNVVKVLNGSRKMFEDLKVLSKTVRDESDEIVPINFYDWILVTRGKKQDKVTSPTPRYFPNKAGEPEFNPEELYDLSNIIIVLTPEEMLDLFNGASLKDIFTLRRASKQVLDSDLELTENVSDDIRDAVHDIFGA